MNINYPKLRQAKGLEYGNHPNKIILHHVEWKGTPEDLNEMMISMGFSMCGYNFYVRMDGSVYAMRPIDAIGGNCYGQNDCSIGIGAEGNFMEDSMPEVQKQAIIELCQYLMQQHPAVQEIGPHKKYYNTDCPGINYPVDQIISAALEGKSIPAAISKVEEQGQSQTNASILDLQKVLNRLNVTDENGNRLAEDGTVGPCTTAAVEKFQKIEGLNSDGIAGVQTWNTIQSILAKPTCSINQQPASIITRYIQYRMVISIDGIWGSGTDAAVKSYQKAKGLQSDGIVGQATWKILIS